MAATRADRRLLLACCAATPARRCTTETTRAAAVATATRPADTSRPAEGRAARAVASAPSASTRYTPRSSHPYPRPTSRAVGSSPTGTADRPPTTATGRSRRSARRARRAGRSAPFVRPTRPAIRAGLGRAGAQPGWARHAADLERSALGRGADPPRRGGSGSWRRMSSRAVRRLRDSHTGFWSPAGFV